MSHPNRPRELPGFWYDEKRNRYFPLSVRPPVNKDEAKTSQSAQQPSVRRTGLLTVLRQSELSARPSASLRQSLVQRWRPQSEQPCPGSADAALLPVPTHVQHVHAEGKVEELCLVTGGKSGTVLGLWEQGGEACLKPLLPKFTAPIASLQYVTRSSSQEEGSNILCVFTMGGCGEMGAMHTYPLSPLGMHMQQRLEFGGTVFAADVLPDTGHAAVGVSRGVWTAAVGGGEERGKQGNVILAGLRNGAIWTIDRRSRGGRGPKARMPGAVTALKALPGDDTYLVASSMDGTMRLWDRRMMRVVLEYPGHRNTHMMLPLAVDAKGHFIAAGGEDSQVRVWDVSSGKLLHSVDPLSGPGTAIAFTHDVPSKACGAEFGLWVGTNEALHFISH
eukprot:jgi/Chlat1/9293/Chrsp99S08495